METSGFTFPSSGCFFNAGSELECFSFITTRGSSTWLKKQQPFETLDYVSLTILRGEEEGKEWGEEEGEEGEEWGEEWGEEEGGEEEGEEWGEEKEKKWEMAGRGGKRKRCYRSGEHNKKKNIKD